MAKLNTQILPKTLFVKIPWCQTFQISVPIGDDGTAYLFQGNGLVPFTANGLVGAGVGNIPSPGDYLAAGFREYGFLYDRYYVHASKIAIEAMVGNNATPVTNGVMQTVLLVQPFDHFSTGTTAGNNDSWQNSLLQLFGYNYDQLASIPYSKTRMIGYNSGGSSRMRVKMFRKTKYAYGVKDVRDNEELQGYTPDYTGITQADLEMVNPHHGFYYYWRCYNLSAATMVVDWTVKMTFYVSFTQREKTPVHQIIT